MLLIHAALFAVATALPLHVREQCVGERTYDVAVVPARNTQRGLTITQPLFHHPFFKMEKPPTMPADAFASLGEEIAAHTHVAVTQNIMWHAVVSCTVTNDGKIRGQLLAAMPATP